MAFEPATVSPLRIQKSNSVTSANSATSHYSNTSQPQQQQQRHMEQQSDVRPKTPAVDAHNHFQDVDSSEVGTPESVIHYSFEDEYNNGDSIFDESSFMPEPSYVPRRLATIRAPDGRLKTRTSATVAELVALKDITQRSNEAGPHVSSTASELRSLEDDHDEGDKPTVNDAAQKSKFNRRQSFRVKLDMPALQEDDGELSFGMDKEFDRLLGASKRGYHMRENDNVIFASNRNVSHENQPPTATSQDENAAMAVEKKPHAARETKSANNSPRKTSGPLTKEPWNGKMRRHSTRRSIIAPEKPMQAAAPGALDTIEDQSFVEDADPGVERGRFFVKVVGAKDLNIPLPRNETCRFQLTLDNGLHCVTTNTIELGRNAPIGQEFELTVFDDLDFSLTLQTQLERPVSKASSHSADDSFSSPSKSKAAKQSAFSRFLSSPKKKRREEEMRQEAEAQAARQRRQDFDSRRSAEPTAWDLLHNLVGEDGSFAQAVISLEEHEAQAYGRPFSIDVPCYNQWAVEEAALASSTKSKHGGIQRKPPYKIGSLSLQMVFVPRPKGVKDEDMPTSMSSCIKQMREAEAAVSKEHEGFLSQQGGDCPFWRRRFFRLSGSSLTSYHETTRQRRANINLTKASKLIDDRSSLTQSAEAGKDKKRRKSAFAADEEGYMFVEEGFRIRFANGEIIDFYADNRQDKDEWMSVLSEVLGRETSTKKPTWTNAVLAREKAAGGKSPAKPTARPAVPAKDTSPTRPGAKSATSSPAKTPRPKSALFEKRPASPIKDQPSAKRTSASGLPTPRSSAATAGRRQAVKSMIF